MKNKSFIKIAILSIILFTFVFSINIYAVEMNANKKEDIIYLKEGETVVSKPGKTYLFRRMHKMIGYYNNEEALDSRWNISIYEKDKKKGIIIDSTNSSETLRLPLKLNGWFKVYVGYASGTSNFTIKKENRLDDVSYTFNESNQDNNKLYGEQFIYEKKVFTCNFNKDTIQIVPHNKTRIAYIKLVGLTSQEINEYTKQDEGDNGKRILYDFDGYSDFFSGIYPDEETLKERTVRRLAQKGVGEINWCLGTTCMLNYNSKYAGKAFDYDHKYDNQLRDGDKLAIEQLSNILKSGKSPIEIIAEEGKKLGVKVNASLRMNAFYPPGKYGFLNGIVYNKYVSYLQPHQELMNYKYPQFRTYVKNILKEAASFENVSGVTLDFCRYPTVMSKEVKQGDKIKIMNQFMKEVRNEIPANKTITVRIPYKDTLSYGFDIKTWVRNGYIDRLVPSNITIEDFFDITPYVNMVKGTKVKLYIGIAADVKGHDLTKEEEELIKKGLYVHKKEYLDINQYLSRAYDVYKKGADGLFLFNTTSKILIDPTAPKEGEYLGDKVKMEKWYKKQYNTEKIEKQKVFISKNTIESFLN